MAIIGFIVLILMAICLLISAWAVAMMEMYMSGNFPKLGSFLALCSCGITWVAFHFAPFTIHFNVS